jgi:hypothetical protein
VYPQQGFHLIERKPPISGRLESPIRQEDRLLRAIATNAKHLGKIEQIVAGEILFARLDLGGE